MLWTCVFLAFSLQLVVSDRGSKCGFPTLYPGKLLEEKYARRPEFNDGDRVVYKCAPGYTHSHGARYTYCQDGVWSLLGLQCDRKRCGSAGEILNGRFRQMGNAFGDKAYAECNEGYVLQGEPVRECLVNGWSGTVPACVVTDFASPALDRTVNCPPPKKNVTVTLHITKATYVPGETLPFYCNVGFQLIGNNNVLQCERSGKWNPSHANCQPMAVQVTCPPPAVPNSGRHDGYKMKYEVGEHVTISCEEGFELIGSSQATCGANGQWREIPKCRFAAGRCQPPPYFPNAHTKYDALKHYEPNTAVRYKCNHGYRTVRGPSTIYCRNGRWTDLQMICEKKNCGSAGEIENGRYHYTGSLFGDTATARCNDGYHLVGVGVRHCRANGWDGRLSVCEATQCPEPPPVPDADLIFETSGIIKHGYVASYRCRFGTLIGASDIVCTKDGTWSDPAPRCEGFCPAPNLSSGVIVAGKRPQYKSGSLVRFRCNPGRRLLGSDVLTCGTNGYWKPGLPQYPLQRDLANQEHSHVPTRRKLHVWKP